MTLSAAAQTASGDADPSPAIMAPPDGIQTRWLFYRPSKYLHMPDFQIHVLATPSLSDDMARQSFRVIRHMVAALKDPADRQRFRGHQAFLITDADPDLSRSGGLPGQRNTGGMGDSLFNVSLICRSAVDTIRPDQPPQYRAWNVPAHEFGHAIESTLGLQGRSDRVFSRYSPNYDPKVAREYFAWANEKWFDSSNDGQTRAVMPDWKYSYLATVFSAADLWKPTNGSTACPGRETAQRVP